MTPVLTDDEIVALVIDADLTWSGLLPTVNTIEHAELADALVRGQRSLFVRGLDPSEAGDSVRACARGTVVLAAYHQDVSGSLLAGSAAVYFFRAEQALLLDVVTPLGVHYIEQSDAELASARLEELLQDSALAMDSYPQGASLAVFIAADPVPVVFSVRGEVVERQGIDEAAASGSSMSELVRSAEAVLTA